RDAYHAVAEERVREESTRQAAHGGAPLLHADGGKVQVKAGGGQPVVPAPPPVPVQGRVEQPGVVAQQEVVPAPAPAPVPATAREEAPFRLQLKAERLQVRKQAEEAGRVRVGKQVVEHTETVTVPVREERVIIERTPVGG